MMLTMLAGAWPWLLGVVATLGVGGVIAFAIGGPATIWLVLRALRGLVITILRSPLGAGAVALAVGLIVGNLYGDAAGRTDERTQCHEAELRAELAVAQQDLKAAKVAAENAINAQAAIEERANARDQQVAELERSLAEHPSADRCRLNARGVERLRDLSPD